MLAFLMVLTSVLIFSVIAVLVTKNPYEVMHDGEKWVLLKDKEVIFFSDSEEDCWIKLHEILAE
jgi:hypothetical protein